MNLFKEHAEHNIQIRWHSEVIGDKEIGETYRVWCKDCEEEVVTDEVFK